MHKGCRRLKNLLPGSSEVQGLPKAERGLVYTWRCNSCVNPQIDHIIITTCSALATSVFSSSSSSSSTPP